MQFCECESVRVCICANLQMCICATSARKSESMAKWEENTKWSKINFLISVFFFFPWINISMKDNEWPFKCFRGRIIPPLCPLNVDMLVNWKKEAFCLNFSNELVFSSFFCVNNMSLWDMLGKTMLFKGMRRKIKKI